MNNKLKSLIKVSIGVAIFFLIYSKVGISNILETLSSMKIIFLVPFVIVLSLTYLISSLNLMVLTSAKCRISLITLLKYATLSWSYGLFSPGKIGEFSLAYFLKKHKFTLGEGFAVALMDKMITFFVLSIFSILGFIMLFGSFAGFATFIILSVALIAGISVISNKKIRGLIRKHLLRRYDEKFKGFFKLFNNIILNKKLISINISLTILKWVVSSTILLFLFLSFGQQITLLEVIGVNSVVVIISLIPITINGLGLREGSAVYLYSLVGIDFGITAAVYLFMRLINYIIAGLALTFLDYDGGVKLG